MEDVNKLLQECNITLSDEDKGVLESLLHNRATISDLLHEERSKRGIDQDKAKLSRLVDMHMDTMMAIWKYVPAYFSPPRGGGAEPDLAGGSPTSLKK